MAALMRPINDIGLVTGKQTIAEWAENAEIIEVLRGLGVGYAQGYGVSQPQRVQRAAIARRLRERVEIVDVGPHRAVQAGDFRIHRLDQEILVRRVRAQAVPEAEMAGRQG